MNGRLALVIGNQKYAPPADLMTPREDAQAIARALKDIGFKVTTRMDLSFLGMKSEIDEFLLAIDQADVALIFFAGHAAQVAGENYLISVDAPIKSEQQLVAWTFPLSEIIERMQREAHRVIAFVDACRDNPFAPIGMAAAAGRTRSLNLQSAKAELPFDSECFTAYSTLSGKKAYDGTGDHSPFTAALLKHIKTADLPISQLMERVNNDVRAATSQYATEGTSEAQVTESKSTLRDTFCFLETKPRYQRPDPGADRFAPKSALQPATFTEKPAAFHCLVVTAELSTSQTLNDHARRMIENYYESEIGPAVLRLRRSGPDGLSGHSGNSPPEVVRSFLDTADAFASPQMVENAVLALCRADVAIFDITDLQPGVMFLLGIRAVARRGVTICSYGDKYVHGHALALPFNIQMLNVAAHSADQAKTATHPHDILGRKIVRGLQDLANLPEYMDLPAYDPVRMLGPATFAPIPMSEKVLLLCPFTKTFHERNWIVLQAELSGKVLQACLKQQERRMGFVSGGQRLERPSLVRLLDEDSPRLVTQTLYELIRRADVCFVDWTGLRPNVMFELGVRLAVNRLGAIHIEDSAPQPGKTDRLAQRNRELRHVRQLRALFNIFSYSSETPKGEPFTNMVDWFVSGFNALGTDEKTLADHRMDSLIYHAVGSAVFGDDSNQPVSVVDELVSRARLLANEDDSSSGTSSVLYSDVKPILRDQAKSAAKERILAAWLCLDARYSKEDIRDDLDLWRQFWKLGWSARPSADAAGQKPSEHDQRIDGRIRQRLNEVGRPRFGAQEGQTTRPNPADVDADISALKHEALALKKDRDYESAIAALQDAVELAGPAGWDTNFSLSRERKGRIAWHLADCYGMIGGNYRRLERLDDAIEAFERGRVYEQDQRFAVPSSYNTVNLISARIERGDRIADQQTREIQQAIATLRHQINDPEMGANSRKTDRWAYADLGQCCLLRGDEETVETARNAYQEFVRLSDASEIMSSCSGLRSLADALVRSNDDAKAAVLRMGAQWLEAELSKRAG